MKSNRIVLGLIFSNNKEWIAGSYYIINIIKALKTLDDNKKPQLLIISDNLAEHEIIKQINYPYIDYTIKYNGYNSTNFNIFKKIFYKLVVRNYHLLFDRRKVLDDVKYVFPNPGGYFFEKLKDNQRINWIPDFQEHYLPQFFSDEEIIYRKKSQYDLSIKKSKVVFSSLDALKDYNDFFPNNISDNQLLNFAVSISDLKMTDFEVVKSKFQLNEDYFYCPNQLWIHKNHIIVLKAILHLKSLGINIQVVFSGKEYDYRFPDHFENIKKMIKENDLESNVLFLGFIDREDQLAIYKHAKAIIQPSLFEGWSTTVEDSKSLNKLMILSDIPVHREQLKENVLFFDPNNEKDLSIKIIEVMKGVPTIPTNYEENIKQFGERFLEIITH